MTNARHTRIDIQEYLYPGSTISLHSHREMEGLDELLETLFGTVYIYPSKLFSKDAEDFLLVDVLTAKYPKDFNIIVGNCKNARTRIVQVKLNPPGKNTLDYELLTIGCTGLIKVTLGTIK